MKASKINYLFIYIQKDIEKGRIKSMVTVSKFMRSLCYLYVVFTKKFTTNHILLYSEANFVFLANCIQKLIKLLEIIYPPYSEAFKR